MLEQMPQALEMEAALLGLLMIEPDTILEAGQLLKARHFYSTAHRYLFEAITTLNQKCQPADIVTVSQYLQEQNQLDQVGGRTYLNDLAINAGFAGSLTHYCTVILDKARRRQSIRAAYKLVEAAQNCESPDFLQHAHNLVLGLESDTMSNRQAALSETLGAGLDELLSTFDPSKQAIGCKTGFRTLDNIIEGLKPSHLVILAARPAAGKTMLGLNIARNVAMAGERVLFFTLEMTAAELAQRLIVAEAGTRHQPSPLADAAARLDGLPLVIVEQPYLTLNDLKLIAKRERLKGGPLGLMVIDYLQLLSSEGSGKPENRVQEISAISRGLKLLARELDVPVLALSQLSRAVENRQDKRPMLSDLRDSGSIEQDADQVWLLYREDYYRQDSARKGEVDVIIGKNRHGATGTATLLFQPALCQFKERICF